MSEMRGVCRFCGVATKSRPACWHCWKAQRQDKVIRLDTGELITLRWSGTLKQFVTVPE